jgi:hypothetical protein
MRRTTAAGTVAAAIALLAAGCGGNDSATTATPPPATTTETTETTETIPPATTETTETTETTAMPAVRTITIVVENGRPKGGIARPEVKLHDRVRVRVRSDVAEEVHVHGYDIAKDVAAGGTVVIPFTADLPGRFEIELEHSGVQLAELAVTP